MWSNYEICKAIVSGIANQVVREFFEEPFVFNAVQNLVGFESRVRLSIDTRECGMDLLWQLSNAAGGDDAARQIHFQEESVVSFTSRRLSFAVQRT